MRRRSWPLVFLLGVLLAGCTSEAPTASAPTPEATATAVQSLQPPSTATPGATVEPTAEASPPTATATATTNPVAATSTVPAPTAMTPQPEDLSLSAGDVFLHPVPDIYAGDAVTFYILADVPPNVEPNDVTVRVEVRDQFTLQGALNGRNLAGDAIGLFAWAWDTAEDAGDHEIVVTLDPEDTVTIGDENPDNNQVVFSVPVMPAHTRPSRETGQVWHESETDCCVLHVVTNTAAYRDLEQLRLSVQAAAEQAAARLQVQPEAKVELYFIDRVIGQGGYASSYTVISYLDRNYAGGGLHEVLVHETAHILDRQFASDRIAFLAEGLAVWAAGGHYKQENIDQRVKALRETNLYLPLPDLINDFYDSQHEVGYLQAAGFLNYLINSYGWERVRSFYADVHPEAGQPNVMAVESSLQRHFDISLGEMETAWMAYLDAIPRSGQAVGDLLTTVRYYDLMRAYQLKYDPTAHFLKAWLPYPQELEQRQLTADVTRHPKSQLNVTLEVMLHAVDEAIVAGDYNKANVILDSLERALANDGAFIDPLGQNYSQIVTLLTSLGFEVHQVDLSGNQARVQVTEGQRLGLRAITMALKNQDWVLLN